MKLSLDRVTTWPVSSGSVSEFEYERHNVALATVTGDISLAWRSGICRSHTARPAVAGVIEGVIEGDTVTEAPRLIFRSDQLVGPATRFGEPVVRPCCSQRALNKLKEPSDRGAGLAGPGHRPRQWSLRVTKPVLFLRSVALVEYLRMVRTLSATPPTPW